DADLVKPVVARLKGLGIAVHAGVKAKQYGAAAATLVIEGPGGQRTDVAADTVLVTVGRRPRADDYGLHLLDLEKAGAAIKIDAQCRTSMRNVWAIGDVTGEPMLAHRAMAQGETVAAIIAGEKRAFDPVAIPAVCFTDPEIVTVGLSPDEAERA